MRLALLAILLLFAGCGGARFDPHSVALKLEFRTGFCSGTATGAAEVTTAAHCFKNGDLVAINGAPVDPRTYTLSDSSGTDVVRVYLDKPRFGVWARRVGKALQRDRVTWYGNPLGVADAYREGYVSAIVPGAYIIAASVCIGDSGAGVFNARGELVAVVSGMPTPLCGSFTQVSAL